MEKPNIKIMSVLPDKTKKAIALLGIYKNISKYNRLLTTKINIAPIIKQMVKLLNIKKDISYISAMININEIIKEDIKNAKEYIENCENGKVKTKW